MYSMQSDNKGQLKAGSSTTPSAGILLINVHLGTFLVILVTLFLVGFKIGVKVTLDLKLLSRPQNEWANIRPLLIVSKPIPHRVSQTY